MGPWPSGPRASGRSEWTRRWESPRWTGASYPHTSVERDHDLASERLFEKSGGRVGTRILVNHVGDAQCRQGTRPNPAKWPRISPEAVKYPRRIDQDVVQDVIQGMEADSQSGKCPPPSGPDHASEWLQGNMHERANDQVGRSQARKGEKIHPSRPSVHHAGSITSSSSSWLTSSGELGPPVAAQRWAPWFAPE